MGWKQGHTPAELSEPLPLAGVLFLEALPSEARLYATVFKLSVRRQSTGIKRLLLLFGMFATFPEQQTTALQERIAMAGTGRIAAPWD